MQPCHANAPGPLVCHCCFAFLPVNCCRRGFGLLGAPALAAWGELSLAPQCSAHLVAQNGKCSLCLITYRPLDYLCNPSGWCNRRIWSVWTNFTNKPVTQLLASVTAAADITRPGVLLPTEPQYVVTQPLFAAGAGWSVRGKRGTSLTGLAGGSLAASPSAALYEIYSTGKIHDNMKLLGNTNILVGLTTIVVFKKKTTKQKPTKKTPTQPKKKPQKTKPKTQEDANGRVASV